MDLLRVTWQYKNRIKMDLSFFSPGPKQFLLCLFESKQLYYLGRRCQIHTHTYTHTNSQNRGNRNKSVKERAYIRSVFLVGVHRTGGDVQKTDPAPSLPTSLSNLEV